MFKWLITNKEWVFSGAGVAVVAGIVSYFFKRRTIPPESRRGSNSQQTIHIAGSVTARGNVSITNIVNDLKAAVSKKEFDRFQSEVKKDQGREKVQQWGKALSSGGVWNWHLLGQAIEHYADAIKCDPTHQHPWTNLGFVLHLIGTKQNARACLEESRRLASPGSNYPGNNYKQVAQAVKNDSYLTGGTVQRPPIPDWFRAKYSNYFA